MPALNDHCFSQPHWLLMAKGYNLNRWYDDDAGDSNGGISFPVRESLNVNHRYYRLASGNKGEDTWFGGAWWMSFDTYKTIERYAQDHELDFPYAARLFLALPYDWTRVDRLVSARLLQPLDAYAGAGKVANASDGNWTPVQHMRVAQLFIPGLIVPRTAEDAAAANGEDDLHRVVWGDKEVRYAHNGKAV